MIGSFNFGNIRTNPANAWQGKTTAPGAAFESFDTPENGVRAIAKVLQTYAGQGANTLESIIGRYSPPHENRTPSLIQAASQRTGYQPAQRLDLSDPAVLDTVTRAIITQEVGNAGPGADVVQRGVKAALPSALPTRDVAMLPTPQAAQENGGMGDFSFGSARSPRRSLTGLLEVADDNNFYDGLGGLLGQGQTPSQPPGPSVAAPTSVSSRMDELMQQLLQSPTRGPSMTPGQYQLAGAGSAVGQLAGVHDRKVGFGEILGALGGGLTRGQLAGEQAQRDDRASQFGELGNVAKLQQYQRAEATNAAKIQAARQWAAQARASGDPKLIAIAAAVENDPSLLDNVLPKQAEAAFPKDQTYTLPPGAQRRDAAGNVIADNPRAPGTPGQPPPPVTLGNGPQGPGVYARNPDGTLGPRLGSSETGQDIDAPQVSPTPEQAQQQGLPPPPANSPYANPNLSSRGRSALVSAQQKAWDKRVADTGEAVRSASTLISDMERFKYLNSQTETGGVPGSPIGSAVRSLYDSNIKEMNSIRDRITPSLRQPGSGATSDFDAKMFQGGTVGVDKPKQVNDNIATATIEGGRNLIAKAQFEQTYFDAYQHTGGMEAAWQKYLNDNPIFDPKAPPGSYKLNDSRVDWQTYFRNGGKVPEKAQQEQAPQQAPQQSPAVSLPPEASRVPGQTYMTGRGPAIWRGTGWELVERQAGAGTGVPGQGVTVQVR